MKWYLINGKWYKGKGSKRKPDNSTRLLPKEYSNLKHLKDINKEV